MVGSWHHRLAVIGVLVALGLVAAWRDPQQAPLASGQDVSLEERVQQLESRLLSAEERIAALEAARNGTPTPAPEIQGYIVAFTEIVSAFDRAERQVFDMARPGITAADVRAGLSIAAASYSSMIIQSRSLAPPACFAATHDALLYAAAAFEMYLPFVRAGNFDEGTRSMYIVGKIFLGEARRLFAEARC